jgi:hypothetical protein
MRLEHSRGNGCFRRLASEKMSIHTRIQITNLGVRINVSLFLRSHQQLELKMEELHAEDQPFIEKPRTTSTEYLVEVNRHIKKSFGKRLYSTLLMIVTLLVLSNCYFIMKWRLAVTTPCIRPQLTFCLLHLPRNSRSSNNRTAPSRKITSYEKKTLWRDIGHNVFTGLPRPEFDQAWHDLLSRECAFSSPTTRAENSDI